MINHERVHKRILTDIGPDILSALKDPAVTEVMLNEDGRVWVETFDGMQPLCEMACGIADNFVRTVASISRKIVNMESPDLGVEIKLNIDGALKRFRFQALIPPLVSSPIFVIRKPAEYIYSLAQFEHHEIITRQQRNAIETAVMNRKNILVAGSVSSGKTTFCNAILNFIAHRFKDDRIIIIEDTPELQCNVDNSLHLRTSDNRSMNDLLRYSMRLRPTRLIIGEVRGQEAHTMIKAWNTGHPGGLGTVQAENAIRTLRRIEQLVQEASINPSPDAIAEAINMVIFMSRTSKVKAGRAVTEILTLDGFDKSRQEYEFECVSRW